MKAKTILTAILMMPFVASFTGCSDDDEPEAKLTKISLNENSLVLSHNDVSVLSVNEDVDVEWSSMDPFVATVDENGVVTGHYVGGTVIEAKTADGLSDVCLVGVMPLYYTFNEPYIEWGKTQADVLAGQEFAQDYTLDGTEVSCSQSTGKIFSARYLIDPDKGLYYSELQIKGDYEQEIYKFLEERYFYVGIEDGARYYMHGLSPDTYDYAVRCYRVKHNSKTYITVAYIWGDYVRSKN
ncbi:MAG: Ig-like domain-containing protein [Bacteroidales bacterium]|nr:Ig-like domain-containing protein [Bacteroidales bacterium]